MQVKDNKTTSKSYSLIGALMLILSQIVQEPHETIILLVVGATLVGTGGYLWVEGRREQA
ncbi:hypothetical protein FVR03_01135 [Pontibacter qinzhouensis]|uniref:Uncharacterized protein n=1 Tax=Pontibacter qinzhouensis TaxID=2603253 RepID=A0A5C8KCL1_9BACT|nr:hypothetical protein [Pontibacter qinzhouensis]TXK52347.1 hypothetical protein FVR03_01135 [Pontibacter qinzhouensis]